MYLKASSALACENVLTGSGLTSPLLTPSFKSWCRSSTWTNIANRTFFNLTSFNASPGRLSQKYDVMYPSWQQRSLYSYAYCLLEVEQSYTGAAYLCGIVSVIKDPVQVNTVKGNVA